MDSIPNNLNPNITGQDTQDINALIQAQVAEVLAKNKPYSDITQPNPGSAPQEYKFNVFGQEHSYKSPEEASKAIEQALIQVRDAAFAQQQAAGVQPKPEVKTNTPGFDRETFAQKIGEDPLKGLEYALGHLIYGGQTDNVASKLREQLTAVDIQKQTMAAYQFREAYPTFPGDQRSIQQLDAIRNELGLPIDRPQSWEAAYNVGIARNVFQSPAQIFAQQEQARQIEAQRQAQLNSFAPPVLGRGVTEPTPSWYSQAEDLNADQLTNLIATLRAQGAR